MHKNLAQYPTIIESIQNSLTRTQGFASPGGVTLAARRFISNPEMGVTLMHRFAGLQRR